MSRPLRVNFVFNNVNDQYPLAKQLRRIGVDAHLYYEYPSDFHNLPESDEPTPWDKRPEWLHPYRPQRSKWQPSNRVDSNLLAEIGQADVIQAQHFCVDWATRTGKPVVMYPYGGDLRTLSGWNGWLMSSLRSMHPALPAIRIPRIHDFLTPLAMRNALRKVSIFLLGNYYSDWISGYNLIDRFGLWDRVRRFPFFLDMDVFHPLPPHQRPVLRRQLLPNVDPGDLLIFHPTRQCLDPKNVSIAYKGNERLYHALARLDRKNVKFHLVVIDKGWQSPEARQLQKELGIDRYVTWLKPMPRHELRRWYWISDLAVDQFGVGGISLVGEEALACGRPLLSYMQLDSDGSRFYDDLHINHLYREIPPLYNAKTVDQIEVALHRIASNPAEREEVGAAAGQWALRNIDMRLAADRLMTIYDELLTRERRAA